MPRFASAHSSKTIIDLENRVRNVRCPGIEQRDECPGHGIEGTEIASLPTIAQRAGQGEILDDGLATVLFGDDVIHLMHRCSKFLLILAIRQEEILLGRRPLPRA